MSPRILSNMNYDFQVLHLSAQFYSDFPKEIYPELLQKKERAYECLLIDLHYDYYICIPFRSEIRHMNAYKFKGSRRSREHQSGLDYSKIVIVNKSEYLECEDAIVDKDEYNEMIRNIDKIALEAEKYVSDYVKHHRGVIRMDNSEYARKYQFCTLVYFHDELGIFFA